jgi:NAD(P)-dependent dehydrogenase (short-subunit alcohol dehydrogenase family)
LKLDDSISAVVTGGASGLGAATAAMLACEGVKVAILDLNEEAGQRHAAAIGARFIACDVTDAASVEQALKRSHRITGWSVRLLLVGAHFSDECRCLVFIQSQFRAAGKINCSAAAAYVEISNLINV